MAVRGRNNADELLIAGLAAGKAVKDAAGTARVSERMAFRRLEDAEFRQRVADVRARMVEAAAGQLASSTGAACERLTKLLEAASESVQFGVARLILEHTVRLRELLDIEARLSRLEERCSTTDAS